MIYRLLPRISSETTHQMTARFQTQVSPHERRGTKPLEIFTKKRLENCQDAFYILQERGLPVGYENRHLVISYYIR